MNLIDCRTLIPAIYYNIKVLPIYPHCILLNSFLPNFIDCLIIEKLIIIIMQLSVSIVGEEVANSLNKLINPSDHAFRFDLLSYNKICLTALILFCIVYATHMIRALHMIKIMKLISHAWYGIKKELMDTDFTHTTLHSWS